MHYWGVGSTAAASREERKQTREREEDDQREAVAQEAHVAVEFDRSTVFSSVHATGRVGPPEAAANIASRFIQLYVALPQKNNKKAIYI